MNETYTNRSWFNHFIPYNMWRGGRECTMGQGHLKLYEVKRGLIDEPEMIHKYNVTLWRNHILLSCQYSIPSIYNPILYYFNRIWMQFILKYFTKNNNTFKYFQEGTRVINFL